MPPLVWAACLLLGQYGCTVDVEEVEPLGGGEACVIASVHSDYVSTSVSLLRADGTLCAEGVLDSGSANLDVVAALSGDVTLPSSTEVEGRVVLVDRYPHAVLSFMNPEDPQEIEQVSVATGYASNPQDVAFLDDGRAYVTRQASNGAARDESGMDTGGDVLILDLVNMQISGRIALSADEGFDPMPSRMVRLGDTVWVALTHLARDFSAAGPGRLVGVDTGRDEVTSVVTLEGLSNCGTATVDMGGQGVWVSCSGPFAADRATQAASSGLVYLREEDGVLVEQWRTEVSELQGSPVSFSVASVAAEQAIFTVFGSLEAQTPDRLLWADAQSGTSTELGIKGSAFELGDLFFIESSGILLLADANPVAPTIRRFEVGSGLLEELESVDGSPTTGLPPRSLQRFR